MRAIVAHHCNGLESLAETHVIGDQDTSTMPDTIPCKEVVLTDQTLTNVFDQNSTPISLRLPEGRSIRFWWVSYDKMSHWSVASSYSTPSFWNCMRVDFNFWSTLLQSTPPSVPSLPLPSPINSPLDRSCEPLDRSCERNKAITGLGTRLSWTYLQFFCTISTGNKIINQISSHACTP